MGGVWKDVCCPLCVWEQKRLNGKSYCFEFGLLGHLLNCVNWVSVGIFVALKKEIKCENMSQFSSISSPFWVDTDTLLILTCLMPLEVSLVPGLSGKSPKSNTLAGPLSSVWVGAVLRQHLVKAALQQSSAAGAQCSTLTTPAETLKSCDLGGFLSLRAWADVEPTRRWWWDHFASAFHGRCSMPFQSWMAA